MEQVTKTSDCALLTVHDTHHLFRGWRAGRRKKKVRKVVIRFIHIVFLPGCREGTHARTHDLSCGARETGEQEAARPECRV